MRFASSCQDGVRCTVNTSVQFALRNSRLSKLAKRLRYCCDLNRRRSCGSHAGNIGSQRWSKELDGDDTCS
ncbi:hypothetical protein L915_04571 [Phytophthora nicotianae]|uniref:Uncharacterized protein n=1 Tax=Phytophthora nicotianae TaxID=4792 RepID=W2HA23_PHYNI|nr:hypothetical protein L915_04571 [Phytophthora nicotianae]